MYTKRIWKEKAHESEFWYQLKLTWLEFRYKEHWGKISKREFFRNFPKYVEEFDLIWEYEEEGVIRIPTLKDYETADKNGYFIKYCWDACYEVYKQDQLSDIGKLCLEFKRMKDPETLIDNYRLKKRLRNDTWLLSETPGNQYRINKNLESEKLLDEQNANIVNEDDGSIDINLKTDIAAKVDMDLSSDEFMNFELDYAEKLIERAKK